MSQPQNRNVRKPLAVRLVAPLDAKENARLAAGAMDPVLAAIVVALSLIHI